MNSQTEIKHTKKDGLFVPVIRHKRNPDISNVIEFQRELTSLNLILSAMSELTPLPEDSKKEDTHTDN